VYSLWDNITIYNSRWPDASVLSTCFSGNLPIIPSMFDLYVLENGKYNDIYDDTERTSDASMFIAFDVL